VVRPDSSVPQGTLERIVIVRTADYWESVASTLTPDGIPLHPGVLMMYVISHQQFDEISRELNQHSLYLATDWHLERGGRPVIHDDMILADDPDKVDDSELIDLARSVFTTTQIDIITDTAELPVRDSERELNAVAERTWVSLGGWCGPSLGLDRLNARHSRGAFDFALSSLAGVDNSILGDGTDYLPPHPFPRVDVTFNRPQEVADRAIMGAAHYRLPEFIHVHEHFDEDPDTWDRLERRQRRTRDQLWSHEGPIFLLRTITGSSWRVERDGLLDLRDRLLLANPRISPIIVAFLHSQHRGTVRLPPIAPGIDTWAIQGAIGSLDGAGLAYRLYQSEYARAIFRVAYDDGHQGKDDPWPPPPDVRDHTVRDHHEHWIF
jgi:hypothetical protein